LDSVTTDREKILSLLLLDDAKSKEIVLTGTWKSPDEIDVRISSCLVLPEKAQEIALEVAQEDGFSAWLPSARDYGSPRDREGKPARTFPILLQPDAEAGIDEFDPLGSIATMRRPRFSDRVISKMGLKSVDPFMRVWKKSKNGIVCRSEAWGTSKRDRDGESDTGNRLCCAKEFVSQLLRAQKMDMLLLVLLRKYEKGYGGNSSKYWHTSAVIHLTSDMTHVYYPGLASARHEHKY
jgi:hypothetical protein